MRSSIENKSAKEMSGRKITLGNALRETVFRGKL